MLKIIQNGCFVVFLIMLLNIPGKAHVRNQIFVGARPQGLGETFTAIANDANAVYWNPAGLPTLQRLEFNSMYANLYNISGMQNIYLSLVYPLNKRFTIGAGWFNYGVKDDELEYARNKVYLSLGAKVVGNLSFGANLKYVAANTQYDQMSAGNARGLGIDTGLLYSLPLKKLKFLKQINLGLMVHDVSGTDLKYSDTHRSEEVFRQNLRFGLSIFAKEEMSLKLFSIQNALLALDIDDRIHLGAEAWFFNMLGLRTGVQKDRHTDEEISWSFGASLKLPFFSSQLDYGYLSPPVLAATNIFSYSYSQSFSPVQIIDARVNDLYASFYNAYAVSPIGNVTVRNDCDEELAMTLQVTIPGLTVQPTQENIKIGPESQQTFAFSIVFSNNILKKKESEFRQVDIRIDYKIKNEEQFVEASEKFRLFGRGAITWDNPGKAAAFITKRDRMVALFAREATKDLAYRTELDLGNIYTAAVLFDAMSAVGIKYQQDPENLFSAIPKDQHSIDFIQYPAELLTSKQGDCDDLTVLYASLLEFSGIKTALVSTPSHITLMFDTGIHERNWGVLPLGDSLVVVKNKTLWIPVEVTQIGNSFVKAWLEGGKIYRNAEVEPGFQVVPVQDVEGIYLSALPEEYQQQVPNLPDSILFANMFAADTTWIQQNRSQLLIDKLLSQLQKDPANIALRNKLGIIYAQQNQIDNAKIHFKYMYNRQPDEFQVLVNLANVYTISGNYSEAEKYYLAAKKVNETEPGLYLNLAILHQLWKSKNPEDSTQCQIKSEKNLLHAFELLKGDEIKSLDLLAISSEDINIGEKADFSSWAKEQAKEIKKYIKNNAKKYLFNKTVKGASLKRKAVKRGVEEEQRFILWWSWS